MAEPGTPNLGEREFETGKDEAASSQNARITASSVSTDKAVDALVIQTLQLGVTAINNAVETANMISKNAVTTLNLTDKQAVAHRDVAVDATWDPGPGEESLKPEPGK